MTGRQPDKKFSALLANLSSFVFNLRWALRQAWTTNALLTVGIVSVTAFESFVPAGIALTARGMINTIVDQLEGRTIEGHLLALWIGLGAGLTIVGSLSALVNKFLTQRLHDELNFRVTSQILEHAATLEVSRFEDPRFEDIMSRARQNSAGHINAFISRVLAAVMQSIQLISLTAIVIAIEPLVALFLVIFATPYLLFHWQCSQKRYLKDRSRATKNRWSGYFTSRLTAHSHIPEVKLFDLAPLLITKFQTLMKEFITQDRQLYLYSFRGSVLFTVLATGAFYALLYRVALQAGNGGISIGDVAIYGSITARMSKTVESTIFAVTGALERVLYVANLVEFFAISPRKVRDRVQSFSPTQGEITVENLSFSYPGTSVPALSDVSLQIHPGETVALVGENGAGKTTLVKLIARLYEPDRGHIFFDGVDIAQVSEQDLYQHISCVFQNFGQYEASAAENIAYGNWRTLLENDNEIEWISRQAGVHELIENMPQGYRTMLGRSFGEYTLSGGQWQQIAIARAFAKDAKLLILDEPTSNLDARSEYRLFCRFRELAKNKTTILISHRFSTVSMADRIFVLEQGRLVECGTHQELLLRKGLYAHLYLLHQRQMGATIV